MVVALGAAFLLGRTWSNDAQTEVGPSQSTITTEGDSEGEADSEIWERNRRIGELEMELRISEDERLDLKRQTEELRRQLAAARESERRYEQGLSDAVEELNRIEADLGQAQVEAERRSNVELWVPTTKTAPLGPPQVTITQMGFVTVSGLVRNPTQNLSRGRLEVSLVGSAGVIETRGFLMRIAPATTERYDITFPGIFPTERIAAQAIWVE
ncbi:MAG: hypothetical protein P8Y44_04770 [Acidobacteriota bacterium]